MGPKSDQGLKKRGRLPVFVRCGCLAKARTNQARFINARLWPSWTHPGQEKKAAHLARPASLSHPALDRLVSFGCAGVFFLGATPVDDLVAGDGHAIGLGAQRLADHRIQFRLDTSGPGGADRLMAWRRDPHAARTGGGGKYRFHVVAQYPLEV